GVAVTATRSDAAWRLDGCANYVTHAQLADVLLVLAHGPAGMGIFEVAANAAGVTISPLPTFDRTLRLARIDFSAAAATPVGTAGWPAAEAAMQLALVALAGEQAGGARRMFEMTVDYAKTRIQFGRAIGSFQAIKHMAADLLIEVESATSAARAAAAALDAAGAGSNEPADAAIHLAAFACADAYTTVTSTAVQMHGGIAFTWDHPAHLYLRRARAQAQLFGAPAFHRERFLIAMGA
ncbi:MAG: acyl-CoA dehydrogenase family protein, partial [Polymorphobacter sp.]